MTNFLTLICKLLWIVSRRKHLEAKKGLKSISLGSELLDRIFSKLVSIHSIMDNFGIDAESYPG